MKIHTILFILIGSLLFGCSLSLVGCQPMHQPNLSNAQTKFPVQSRQAMVAGLKSLTTWQADGVFSFESSNQVGMAHFRVDVTPYTWRVQISSALNIAQMTIGSDALGVWYTDQHGHIQHAQSLESVMRAQFGFALPMLALQDWMKGLAASDQAIQTLNAFNQLQQLEEDGWTLAYSNYGLYHNLTLPGMIVMMGNDQKIKMVIDKWR